MANVSQESMYVKSLVTYIDSSVMSKLRHHHHYQRSNPIYFIWIHFPLLMYCQCDQIGRFIGLWATFQSLLQQLDCPYLPHSFAIFVKVSKSLIFLVKSFWATFIDLWRLFTGHIVYGPRSRSRDRDIRSKKTRKINFSLTLVSKLNQLV